MPQTRKVVPLKAAASVLFGVEMEFASPNYSGGSSNSERETNDKLEKAIRGWDTGKRVMEYGRDGGGIEVDLKPFTFAEYSSKGKSIFSFLDIVKQHNYTGENNGSGMHVHVNRNIFNVTSFGKFLKFILEYKEQIHKISRRGNRSSYTNIMTTTGKTGKPFDYNKPEQWTEAFEN